MGKSNFPLKFSEDFSAIDLKADFSVIGLYVNFRPNFKMAIFFRENFRRWLTLDSDYFSVNFSVIDLKGKFSVI